MSAGAREWIEAMNKYRNLTKVFMPFSDTNSNWSVALTGDYSEDGFMALYEVAIVTKNETGERLAYGPRAVLAKTKEAAIALASAEAGAEVLGSNPQVLVRPFVTGT